MAGRESMGQNVDPGVVARVVAGIKYAVTGVGPMNFFGPAQPLTPIAQDEVEGRQWDYPVGYNLRIQPRSGENVSFYDLRALADGYDLMRLVIETRKDQIKSYDWEVVPKDFEANPNDPKIQAQVQKVSQFMESPDKEHTWDDWISMLVEDLLVLDAVCVYPRMNKGQNLYGFELVDAATIKRVLDDSGRTPMPPDVAYQQIIKGIPAADYSSDMLYYMARNQRTNRVYGYGPVEQVLMTVNIALRRQMTQLDFYTAGNIPEAIAQVPDTWTPKQIREFQDWWDSVNEGSGARSKRRMTFIPMLKDITFPRKDVLKDEFDEWLARIVCFAFSIPPTAFIKQSNRATAEQADQSAKEEGLRPLLRWLENKITVLVQRYLKCPDVAFKWKIEAAIDPLIQAQCDQIYVTIKAKTPDEVREELGMDAMTPEEREKAFPSPPTPGFDENGAPIAKAPNPNEPMAQDGKPKSGAPKNPNPPLTADQKPKQASAAEKMLETALAMLDPAKIAGVIAKVNASQPPNVIEHRPQINVEVGDTNVHAFKPRDPPDQRLGKVLKGRRGADGVMEAWWEDKPIEQQEASQ